MSPWLPDASRITQPEFPAGGALCCHPSLCEPASHPRCMPIASRIEITDVDPARSCRTNFSTRQYVDTTAPVLGRHHNSDACVFLFSPSLSFRIFLDCYSGYAITPRLYTPTPTHTYTQAQAHRHSPSRCHCAGSKMMRFQNKNAFCPNFGLTRSQLQ